MEFLLCAARNGFTLIELLVVMTIVSILAAVSIPQFQQYKQRAFDLRATNDLRSVAIAEEAYFIDYEIYRSCSNQSCTVLPGIKVLSAGVSLTIEAHETGFTGTASHRKGSGKIFLWDSEQGGLINR